MSPKNIIPILFLGALVLVLAGCGSSSDGEDRTNVQLQTDTSLTLYCADVGLYGEDCVLDDPNNPFAMVSVTEENKWDLHTATPSAKSNFYLWATAFAKTPTGENQYYVASALHALYTEGNSPNAKAQAIRAYRSVLDNFYDSITYWEAWWLPGTPTPVYAVPLKDLTGMRIYDPTPDSLAPLFSDEYLGLNELALWGYTYDPSFDPATNITGAGTLY